MRSKPFILGENAGFLKEIAIFCNPAYKVHPAGDVLWVFVEPGNVVP